MDGSCSHSTDINSNIGENIGCCNAFGCLVTIAALSAGASLKLRGNYLAQPVNYPRAVGNFIYAASWNNISWNEDNFAQNGFVSPYVQMDSVFPTVGASPWTFTNNNLSAVSMSIAGGTVLSINISRNGQTAYASGLTNGMIDLKSGDAMTVAYTVAPTVTMIPRLGQ